MKYRIIEMLHALAVTQTLSKLEIQDEIRHILREVDAQTPPSAEELHQMEDRSGND